MSSSHIWMAPSTHKFPLHMWIAPICECPFHMWVTPTCEYPFHMWVTLTPKCLLHMWVSPPRECPLHMWVSPTRECPSTIEEMLHVRALPCMWATCELYMRGSPPPLRECYTWGHYRARELHVSCTWGAPLHHWGNATCEGITMHVSHTWAVCEGLPSHHWGNATREGTMHVSYTWLTCMHTAPLDLPKKVTKKQPVNHIGNSDEPPIKS